MYDKSAFPKQAILPFIMAAVLCPALALQQSTNPGKLATTDPGFTVTITYSQRAMQTLVARKEKVIVTGYLSGSPIESTPIRYVDGIGEIDLGETDVEIAPGETATFDHIKFDRSLLKWVDSQGVQLLINVISGRSPSSDNLLDCGLYQGSLKDAQGKSLPIACKLLGE